MPYPRVWSEYVLPEFEARAPDSWERRLREISPVSPNLAHLGFRKFESRPDWRESPYNREPERPLWAIYRRTPKHLTEPGMAKALATHWRECTTEAERVAHRAMVSDYQHFMWRTQAVFVAPFWLLQGEWGGTPMKFTRRETRYLDAAGSPSIPAPPGTFTPCPFNERSVAKIVERDRFIQAGNRFDMLEQQERPAAKRAEDEAAEAVYRARVLEHLAALAAPAAEFMKSQTGKAQVADAVVAGDMPPAPCGLPDTLAVWQDEFKRTGRLMGVGAPRTQKVFATS